MKVKILESSYHMFHDGTVFPTREVDAEYYKNDVSLVEVTEQELKRVGLYTVYPYNQQPSVLLSITHSEVEIIEAEEPNREFHSGDLVIHKGQVSTLIYYGIEYSSIKGQDRQYTWLNQKR